MATTLNGKAPQGGVRINGRNYRAGADIRGARAARDQRMQLDFYRRMQEMSARPGDPARRSSAMPANVGRAVVPHALTFRGLYTSLAKAYKITDSALRHSRELAEMMRLDDAVMGPLLARQKMVALLNWHIEPEDEKDPEQKAIVRELTYLLGKMQKPFVEYRRNLMEAIWYGRAAVQNKWGVLYNREGKRRYYIRDWSPVHGDKLAFRYDDGTGTYDPDQIGVRMSPTLGRRDDLAGTRTLEYTPDGPAYFLEPWERSLVSLHRYMICDSSWEDPIGGISIHGTGIRHFLFWTWYAKQETFAQLVDLIERTAQGITIYRYPDGNDRAKEQVEEIAKQQAHTNVLVMPMNPEAPDEYAVEVIPVSTNGLDQLNDIVTNHFNDQVTRFILGQTLSRKTDATGMNSGIADLHEDSMLQILQYDAHCLELTGTNEMLRPLIDFNYPKHRHLDFWFRLNTKQAAAGERLEAIRQAFDMGCKIKTDDVLDVVGLAMPSAGDDYLSAEQLQQAQSMGAFPGLQMGGEAADLGSGMPPGDDRIPSITTSDGDGDGFAGGPMEDNNAGLQPDVVKLFGPVLDRYEKKASTRIDEAVARWREPTDAQRDAGNYHKPKVTLHGMEISIETPKGKRRRKQWPTMQAHYGYFNRTVGADGDHLDVFIGPCPDCETVYVVDQVGADGRFDEHKVMMGFDTRKHAKEAYLGCYKSGWKMGPITPMTIDQFKTWLAKYSQSRPVRTSPIVKYAKQMRLFGDQEEVNEEEVNEDDFTGYKPVGTTQDITTCDRCGRTDLKKTVIMAPTDAEGNKIGSPAHMGIVCASIVAKTTEKEIRKRVKEINDKERDDKRQASSAKHQSDMASFHSWLEENGTGESVIERIKSLGGFSAANRQWQESEKYARHWVYAKQMGLFGEDYEPKKDKKKPTPKADKPKQGKLFSTSGLPGQQDFMGETPTSVDLSRDSRGEGWNEEDHPREPEGTSKGGQFASKESLSEIATKALQSGSSFAQFANEHVYVSDDYDDIREEFESIDVSEWNDAKSLVGTVGIVLGNNRKSYVGRIERVGVDNGSVYVDVDGYKTSPFAVSDFHKKFAKWLRQNDDHEPAEGDFELAVKFADEERGKEENIGRLLERLGYGKITDRAHRAMRKKMIDRPIIGDRYAKHWEDQPREPKGQADGGQFTSTSKEARGVVDLKTMERDTDKSGRFADKEGAYWRLNWGEFTPEQLHENHTSETWVGDEDTRRGLSTTATLSELVDYFATSESSGYVGRGANLSAEVHLVQVSGDPSGDEARDEGEHLIHPRELISSTPLHETPFLEMLKERINERHGDDRTEFDIGRGGNWHEWASIPKGASGLSDDAIELLDGMTPGEFLMSPDDVQLAEEDDPELLQEIRNAHRARKHDRYAKHWEDQPRKPKGQADGGQFAESGGVGSIPDPPPAFQDAQEYTPTQPLSDDELARLGVNLTSEPEFGLDLEEEDWDLHKQLADEARESGRRAPRDEKPASKPSASDGAKPDTGVGKWLDKLQPGERAGGFIKQEDGSYVHKHDKTRIVDAATLQQSLEAHISGGYPTPIPDPANASKEWKPPAPPSPEPPDAPGVKSLAEQKRERDANNPTPPPKETPKRGWDRKAREMDDMPDGTQMAGFTKSTDQYGEVTWTDQDGRRLASAQLERKMRREQGTQPSPQPHRPQEPTPESAYQDVASAYGIPDATPETIQTLASQAGLPASNPDEAADSLRRASQYANQAIEIAQRAGYMPSGADPLHESQQAVQWLQEQAGHPQTGDPVRDLLAAAGPIGELFGQSGVSPMAVVGFIAAFWLVKTIYIGKS